MGEPPKGRERRVFVRIAKALPVHYKVIRIPKSPEDIVNPVEMQSTTKDISAGGLSFYLKERLELFSVLEIRLELPNEPTPVVCLAEVVRCRLVENTPYSDTAVCFLDLTNRDRRILTTFIQKQP